MDFNPYDIADDDPVYLEELAKLRGGAGKKQNSGLAGDLGTGLKIGVEQLPGVATGLADTVLAPISKMTGVNRPVSRAADWLGEQTGFQPSEWAKQAEDEYSPQYRAAKQDVQDTKGFLPTVGALARNPRFIAGTVAESLPSMVAGMGVGGVAARGVVGAEKIAALRTAAAAGDKAALAQLGSAGALAGFAGEGVVTAGQHMSQTDYDTDPLLAAGTAIASGVGTGLIGAMGGRLAAKMGVSDIDTLAVTGLANRGATASVKDVAKNVGKGAFTEGVLEELPQSMQEQIWQNVASGKPWNEGVAEQGAIGMMAGAAMGAGANVMPRRAPKPEDKPVVDEKEPVSLLGHNPEIGTSWNNTYNYNPIIAEASEAQVPLEQLDMLNLGRNMTEAREMMNADLSQRRQDALYDMPEFNLNDQELPLPTDPGSAVAVIQVLSNAAEQGQAIPEGSPAHKALVEAQRILSISGLSYIASRAPVIAKGKTNATTQVAQESGQGASGVAGGSTGNTQDQSGVGRGGNELAAAPVLGSGTDQSVGDTRVGNGAGVSVTEPAQVVAQAQKANDAKAGTKSGTALAAQGVKPGTKGALEAAVTELMPEESTERQDHINAIQTAKSYTAARKALAKMSPQGLKIALRSAPQEEQRVVQTALGWDAQGNQVGSRIASYADVAKAVGLNSRQRVQQILKSYGIDSDVINRMNAADQQAVSVSELMPSQQEDGGAQDGTGFRIMDNPNASDDIVDDRKTRIETHLANKFAAEQGVTAKDLAQGVVATTEESPEVVRNRQEAARKSELAMLDEARAIAGAYAEEAMSTWNEIAESASPQGPGFHTISPKDQVAWLLEYKEFIGEHGDEKFEEYWPKLVKLYDEYTSVTQVNNESGQIETARTAGFQSIKGTDTGATSRVERLGVQSANTGEQTQDTARAEQTGSAEGSADGVKYSKLADELSQWKQAVNDWVSGKTPRTSSPVVFSSTPASLQALGLPNLEVRAAGGHFIEDSLYDHGVKSSQLVEVVRDITDPVAVYAYTGSDGKFSLNIVTRQFVGGNRLIVALQPSKYSVTSSPVHFTATVFGRSDATIGGHLQKGMVYQGVTEDMSPELKSATIEYKKKHGQTAIDLSATHNGKFDNLPRSGKLAYKSDLVKLIAEGKAQYSTGVQGSTQASAIEGKLKPLFFSNSRFSSRVVVVQSATALPQNLQSAIDGNTQAFVQGGKVYMIADNIAEGKELAVFLHEVGVHLGMKGLIGQENLNRLAMQIKRWATSNDGSVESELAKKALARVKSAQQGGVDMELGDVIEERVAYFVEEAVNAGINPTALDKASGPLQRWFRTMWAAVKTALRKFGLDRVHTLTAQNLVDLSYGAARLELEGTWHGTAADFRNFNHEYMGSGEGAQAFGWGTYLAQRPGIAKGYWKDDVRRKAPKALAGGKFINRDSGEVVTLDRAQSWLPDEDFYAIKDAIESGNKRHLEAALQTMLRAIDYNGDWVIEDYPSINKTESPDGSLMRVDTAVHEDEMLDWDKPLSEQSEVVKKALAEAKFMPDDVKGAIAVRARELIRAAKNLPAYATLSEHAPQTLKAVDALEDAIYDKKPYYEVLNLVTALRNDAFGSQIPNIDTVVGGLNKLYDSMGNQTGASAYEYLTSEKGSDKAASEYLDSIGIKGIKFLDAQSRDHRVFSVEESNGRYTVWDQYDNDHGTYATKQEADAAAKRFTESELGNQTRNLVIFNDKNIQRVVTQVGADRERVKFSKTAQAVKQYGGESGVQVWEDASGVASRAFKWFMSLHDLVGKYGDVLPSAKGWYDSVRATAAARNRIKEDAESIAARAGKLNKVVLKQLNEFISKSTYEQKWGYDATFDKLDGTKRDVKADPEMAKLFRALPKDAQEIAKAVFAHGEKMKIEKFKIMKQLGLDKDTFLEQGSLTGPYAPLKRFGDYVAILKSKELRAAEQAGDTKKVEELKANPDHYAVSNFDTLGQAKKFARANEATFGWSDAFKGSINVEVGHRMKPETLQKVLAAVKAEDLPSNVKGQVETMVREMYLSAFDEHNARMSGLKRKNRAGYDADMIRSFLAHARAEAGFLSNMQHGGKTNELFYKLQQEAKNDDGKRTGQDVFNAIAQHYAANLDHKDTPIQDRVLAFTSIMQLATNPAYHIQNLMQPLMVSVPRLAGDFNDYGGAWNALRQGYAISREMVKGNIFKLETEIDLSVVKNTKLREMLQTAADAGLLDVGMDEDLANFESTRTGYELVDNASNGMKKVVHKLRQMSRRVEATNRISAAVAAYNMSYGRNKDHAKATEYAISVLQDTQGDFSKTDAPLIIKRLPKFMVQYRKFQLMMAAHYVKAFNDAFRSEDAETRAVGRRTLLISLGHALGSAGVMGLPLMNVVGLIFKATGSDDEPRDLERTLREMFGDNANYLLRGPFWFMGLDAKLSQDKVFSILPYADWDLTSRKGGTNLLVGLTGPSGSNGLRMLEGFGKMAEGDYYKGLAGILPSGLANGVKAFQVANKGYTLKNGDVMVKPEDIETFQLLLDSIGMKSPEMRRMDWYKNQQWEVKQFYSDRSKEIQREYAEAFKEKDTAQLAELRQDWMDLQAGKDHLRYLFGDNHDELKRQPLSNLIKYPQTVANRERKLQRSVVD